MGSLASFPYLPAVASNANILSEADWASASDSLTQLVVGSGCCNEEQLTQLDFGRFAELRSVRIGCYCCIHVNEVKLIGGESKGGHSVAVLLSEGLSQSEGIENWGPIVQGLWCVRD